MANLKGLLGNRRMDIVPNARIRVGVVLGNEKGEENGELYGY